MAKIKKTGRHTSALKAHRQSIKRYYRNLAWKKKAKKLIKELTDLVEQKKKNEAMEKLKEVFSVLDKMGQRNIFHRNKVSRIKSKLSKKVSLI
ncbi:MAG: 30S ribosomal protein S20 [bacterium]|nr:30S ribosomal protein S20 [bacterium]